MKFLKQSVLFTLGLSLSVMSGRPIPVSAQSCDPSMMSCLDEPPSSSSVYDSGSGLTACDANPSSIFCMDEPPTSSPPFEPGSGSSQPSSPPDTSSVDTDYAACMKEVDANKSACQHRGMVLCGVTGGRFGANPVTGGLVGGVCSAIYDKACNRDSRVGNEYCEDKKNCIEGGKSASECGDSPYFLDDPWPE